jgi:hypothetical protein
VTAITIKPTEPGDELVRLKNSGNADEANLECQSFKPDRWGAFHIPKRLVTRELMSIGGFFPAPISMSEALQDVSDAIAAMPEGAERGALSAALVSIFPDADDE